ncbi:hypothetical protein CHCC14814_0589 [Bacillus paralicheniformis]|nr:hypothetical protein CHCC14814_0589 [Bacillus paralicheniformis]
MKELSRATAAAHLQTDWLHFPKDLITHHFLRLIMSTR